MLGDGVLFGLERRQLWGHLTVDPSISEEVIEKREPGSTQQCMVGGEDTTGMS